MVLEADDEVICISEPFINAGSGGTPCASEVAALTRHRQQHVLGSAVL
jgi:hypothetical protein